MLKDENPSPSIDNIFELAGYSLNRVREWIASSKERLSFVSYKATLSIDNVTLALRQAFELASIGQFQKAIEMLDSVINNETDEKSKGFLMLIKADYANWLDRNKAQQILQSARKYNSGVTAPIEGIQYEKLINNKAQAQALLEYLASINTNPNDYIIHIHAILNELSFNPNADANLFEHALEEVGVMLGFKSSRPDKEGTGGPDNLWAVGNNQYFVIECKNGATSDSISKDYCNQIGGSMRWFDNEYGNMFAGDPIMIHCTNEVHPLASPPRNMRIITPVLLDKIKRNITAFIAALVQSGNWQDESTVNSLLSTYKLRGQDIKSEYSAPFTKAHK